MRFRRRRSRATWSHADADSLSVYGTGPTQFAWAWLIPPARVGFLCDSDRVNSLMFMGAHLWLDFAWTLQSSDASVTEAIPDVTFYVKRFEGELVGGVSQPANILTYNPWIEPATPASLTSWETEENDGTDSFLWCHHIKGISPANYRGLGNVEVNGTTVPHPNTGNQVTVMETLAANAPSIMCRKHFVAAEWQPDVIIKSRRRLSKDQGVALVVHVDTPTSSMVARLDARFRTLMRRGR